MRVLGSALLFPFVPAASKNAPAEAAMPRAVVATSALTNCIVSYIASIAELLPPGEFMYRWMSCSGSSASRCKSCAMITFAT
jgi:hypothetical protein